MLKAISVTELENNFYLAKYVHFYDYFKFDLMHYINAIDQITHNCRNIFKSMFSVFLCQKKY